MKRFIFSLFGLLMLGPSIMVYGSTAPDSVIYYYGFEDNLDSFSEDNPQDSIEGIWYCDDDLNKVYFNDTVIYVNNKISQIIYGPSQYSLEKENIEISRVSAVNSIATEYNNVFKATLGLEAEMLILQRYNFFDIKFKTNENFRFSFKTSIL